MLLTDTQIKEIQERLEIRQGEEPGDVLVRNQQILGYNDTSYAEVYGVLARIRDHMRQQPDHTPEKEAELQEAMRLSVLLHKSNKRRAEMAINEIVPGSYPLPEGPTDGISRFRLCRRKSSSSRNLSCKYALLGCTRLGICRRWSVPCCADRSSCSLRLSELRLRDGSVATSPEADSLRDSDPRSLEWQYSSEELLAGGAEPKSRHWNLELSLDQGLTGGLCRICVCPLLGGGAVPFALNFRALRTRDCLLWCAEN